MKFQQLPVFACFVVFLLFLVTISPEFTEAAFPKPRGGFFSGFGDYSPANLERLEKLMKDADKIKRSKEASEIWYEYTPGHFTKECRHPTKVGPLEDMTICGLTKCTQSCETQKYKCGICIKTNLCRCYD